MSPFYSPNILSALRILTPVVAKLDFQVPGYRRKYLGIGREQ